MIQAYAGILAELISAAGGTVIRMRTVTDELGPAAFDGDGMHLTRAAYLRLVPQLAEAIDSIA